MKRLMLAAVALLALGCPPNPVTPSPDVDTADSAVRANCKTACENLRKLGCPAGAPTSKGASCEDVCTNDEANGIDFHKACKTSAPSCEVAKACYKH